MFVVIMDPDSYFFSLEKKSNDKIFWEDGGEMNYKQKKSWSFKLF